MAGSKVTIVDIAQALGISKTAVSAALHGSGRVSTATRERVAAKATELGYESNRAAQRLRGGRHHAIGLSIPRDVRDLAFYLEFTFGVADVAAELGLDLVLLAERPASMPAPAAVDGILVLDPTPESVKAIIRPAGEPPIVSVGDYDGVHTERILATLSADHLALVSDLLTELQHRGSERIGLVAIDEQRELRWAQDVVTGYMRWCQDHAQQPALARLPIHPSDEEIQQQLDRFAAEDVDAVIWVAQGLAMRALVLNRFDASITMASMALEADASTLLGVDLMAREYGRDAAKLLDQVIAGQVPKGHYVTHQARLAGPGLHSPQP